MINFNRAWVDDDGIQHMNGSFLGMYVGYIRVNDRWIQIAKDYDIEMYEQLDELESEWLEEIFQKHKA